MKLSLQLKLGQSLTMTPQLQQAIRLLQLSSIELQAEVQDVLESNMMLELDEGDSEQNTPDEASNQTEEFKSESDSSDQVTKMNQDNIPDDLPVDSNWEDVYDSTPSYTKVSTNNYEYDSFENQDTRGGNTTRTS